MSEGSADDESIVFAIGEIMVYIWELLRTSHL